MGTVRSPHVSTQDQSGTCIEKLFVPDLLVLHRQECTRCVACVGLERRNTNVLRAVPATVPCLATSLTRKSARARRRLWSRNLTLMWVVVENLPVTRTLPIYSPQQTPSPRKSYNFSQNLRN